MNAAKSDIPRVTLADGTRLPALGLGTWRMGERMGAAARELAALKRGLDVGITLIDTAEMYGSGGAVKNSGETQHPVVGTAAATGADGN